MAETSPPSPTTPPVADLTDPTATEALVQRQYSAMTEQLRREGFRSTVFYMTAKHLADWELINGIPLEGARVLNLGCCEPLDELFWCRRPVKEWVATDLNPDMVAVAEEIFAHEAPPAHRHKVRFEVADATALTYPTGSFDAVVSLHAIDHVADAGKRQAWVNEMARVTRPGGHVVLVSSNRYGSFLAEHQRLCQQPGGPSYGYMYFFTPRELQELLVNAGLQPLRFTSELRLADPYANGWKRWLNRWLVRFGNRIGYLAKKP